MKSSNIQTDYVISAENAVVSKFVTPRGEQPSREQLISLAARAVVEDCREFPSQVQMVAEYINLLADAAAQCILSATCYDSDSTLQYEVAEEIASAAHSRLSNVDFHCHKCGKETASAPDPPEKAVCEDCCEDHDYRYVQGERRHACIHCDKDAPSYWYY
jgi:hypothetical protein